MKHKLAIIGASGYTGAELIRLIETHPKMEVTALSGILKLVRPCRTYFHIYPI